jgi:energy-coupling factor transporter ATP-binding protein EcfA2
MIDSEIFTEQAEYLSGSSFKKWSVSHQNEADTLRKLTQAGAKLITGPRGCGKTTLMLKAFSKLMTNSKGNGFPVYVNYKSSLKLEPLYRSNTNAAYWFNQWVMLKVISGIYSTLVELGIEENVYKLTKDQAAKNIELLEMGRIDLLNDKEDQVTLNEIHSLADKICEMTSKSRFIILLDDAGHAFSSDQQKDFFEFYRQIKSKRISPKAAVYPGVINYSSSFHVGHDAEEIDVWVKPNSEGYLDFMHSLLKSRFESHVFESLIADKNLLNLMCFAAYGIPRALLNMISSVCIERDDGEVSVKLTAKNTLKEIKNSYDSTYSIYDSLKIKLPMYRNFIDTGSNFYEQILKIIKGFNKGASVAKQSSIIAIKRPVSAELEKVIGFFQYAGLLSPDGISNRGGKGVYELYEVHYAAIIDRNVFFSSRAINIENYIEAFSNRPNHHYPRHSENSLMLEVNLEEAFSLALPSCEVCKSPRVSDKAKFCMECGSKLKDTSIFEDIVSQDIECLPITIGRADSIKQSSKIRKIKDILMDYENKELRKVNMIGPAWAKKIRSYAEEFIA